MMGGGGFGFGHGVFGLFFWLIVVVAVVWAIRGALRGSSREERDVGNGKSPMEILQERYARGEIDQEEFERRRHDLRD